MYKIKNIGLILIPTGLVFGSINMGPSLNLPTIAPRFSANEMLNYHKSIKEIIDPEKLDKNKTFILIEKSKYRLTVYYNGKPLKSYPCVLGSNPVDDKLKDGDGCTPEGKFKIKSLYKHPHWNKFIWLSYPTVESWKKYTYAKYKGQLQLADSIGGKIGITGAPDNNQSIIQKKINWTKGNISLKDKDIDEIYDSVKEGSPVEILH